MAGWGWEAHHACTCDPPGPACRALRRLARHEPNRRAAMRLLAIAHALDGFSRAEAARLAGMERQALRDAVIRYNAEGPAGLHDRPRSGRPEALTPGQQAALKAWVLRKRHLNVLAFRHGWQP